MLISRQKQVTRLTCLGLVGVMGILLASCSGPGVGGAASLAPAALVLPQGQTLAAIGVKAQRREGGDSGQVGWQDRRVAFGLTNLLAEGFYDTGKFRLVEEKELHQRQLIEELVELFWDDTRPRPPDPELTGIGKQLAADLLAYGTLGYARASGQRLQLGPVGSYQQRLRITVAVCLYEVSSRITLCREGQGMAQQEGVGVAYEFRADRPDFEKNALGRATKQAVTQAIQALTGAIHFSP